MDEAHVRRRRTSAARSTPATSNWTKEEWSTNRIVAMLFDAILLFLLCGAPLLMAGRQPVGRLIFVAAVMLLALVAMFRPARRLSPLGSPVIVFLLGAGLLLVLLQITPLPPELLQKISPAVTQRLPLWSVNNAEAWGQWQTISIVPSESRIGLAVYAAYAILFLVTAQRMETLADVRRIIRYCGWSAGGMALLGVVQYLIPNGKFVWMFAHPTAETYHEAKASFANPNHFAHFLVLGLVCLAGSWQSAANSRAGRSQHPSRPIGSPLSWLYAATMAVTLVGIALSYSRGGVLVAVLALLAYTAVCWSSGATMAGYRPKVLGLVLVVPLVSGIAVGLHGYDKVWSQLQTLWQASSVASTSAGRPVVWRASLEAVSEFARFGAGAGSHRSVHPTYLAKSVPVEFTHAESGYLQIAEELGMPGLALLFLVGCCVLHWIRCAVPAVAKDGARREIVGPLLAAVVAAMAASFAHSLFDFVWYIPACMTMAVVLAASLRQLALQTNSELSPLESTVTHDPVWKLVSVCFLLVMVCCLPHLYHDAQGQAAWEDYFTLSLASDIDQSGMTRRGRLRMTRIKADDPQVSRQMLQCLDQVLAVDDDHHLAHARKATLLLKQFDQLQLASDNAMTLSQLRDAAVASRFPTLGEQNQWLAGVVQDRMPLLAAAYRHAQKAVQLAPFQGDAYVLLSELSFLTSDDADAKNAFLQQAALVRPKDGRVLLAMGQDAALQGNLETALSHWKEAFHQGVEFRQTLTSLLGNVLAAEDFMQHFQPTYAQLSGLAEFYFAQGQTAEAIVVLEQQVRLAISDSNDDDKSESEVGSVWTELAAAFRQMGRPDRAATMTLKALDRDPYAYELRRQLAMDLLLSGQRDTGMEYVRWCLNQRPSDHELRSVLADSLRIRDDRQVSQASYLVGEKDSKAPARLPRRP